MQVSIPSSGGVTLEGYLAVPDVPGPTGLPGVVISHGFPDGPGGGSNSPQSYPQLADRIADEMGWVVVVPFLRGMQASTGDFSLVGWRNDIVSAAKYCSEQERVNAVWLVGFGTAGALSIAAGTIDSSVRGVASLAAPADFSDWANAPDKLLTHARNCGAIKTPGYPEDPESWERALSEISAVQAAEDLAPTNLMLMHGSADEVVPQFDARAIADAHGTADLRIVQGAGHYLRFDPRSVAILLGWLDRQRRQVAV